MAAAGAAVKIVGKAAWQSAKKYLATKGKEIARKAAQKAIQKGISKVKSQAGKTLLNTAEKSINRITSSEMGEYSDNPIRQSSKALVADGRIIEKSQADGIVLGGSKNGGSMGLIIAAVAALFLLPAIMKKR